MRRVISGFLVLVMLMGFGEVVYGEVSIVARDGQSKVFVDVNGYDWYYEHLEKLVGKGIIDGYTDNTFRPMNNVRVDEFIKTMVVALGHNPGNGSGYWASEYINKAKELGIISETDFSDYTKTISRAEMAMVAVNTVVALEGSQDYKLADEVAKAITDYDTAVKASIYKTDIVNVYELGIITGYPDGSFGPDNNLTRAEAVTVIRRVIDFSVRKPFKTGDIARLSRYAHDTSGDYDSPNDLLERGSDQQYFVDLTVEYINARYNADYNKVAYGTFTKNLKWFYSPSARWGDGRTAEEEVDEIYWGIMNNQIVQEVYVVSDKSLVYENRLGKITVPVTFYFVTRHTSYGDYTGTLDKWMKFDAEYYWANNAVKLEMSDAWEYNKFKYNGSFLLSDENMEVD